MRDAIKPSYVCLFILGMGHTCFASAPIIDPAKHHLFFENSSAALRSFYRMQDSFLGGEHHVLFDATTIHTMSTDYRIPVTDSLPLFEAPYDKGGVEHHHVILQVRTSSFGVYALADITSVVPVEEGKVKYDAIDWWTYGESIIGAYYTHAGHQYHVGVFQKIMPRSHENQYTYDPDMIDGQESPPFYDAAMSASTDYAFLNYTRGRSWNISAILGPTGFSLYSLNLRYHTRLSETLGDLLPDLDYFRKHKNVKPGIVWRGPRLGQAVLMENGFKLRDGFNLENLATGLTLFVGVDDEHSLWTIPENDFHLAVSLRASYSDYIDPLWGFYGKLDLVNIPYIDFFSIGYSRDYYYNILRVPFEDCDKLTFDWTLRF